MRRQTAFLVILVLLVFGCLFAPQALAQEDLPNLVKKIQPAVVTIIAYDAKGKPKAQGTGFFISQEGHFITNYHVLEGASWVELKTSYGQLYYVGKVLAEDQLSDLILAVIGPGHIFTKDQIVFDEPGRPPPAIKVPKEKKDFSHADYSLKQPFLKISGDMPEVGERIVVVGSPMGLEQTLSEGVVSAIRHTKEFGEILQITAPISPGSSGSPVVNMKGEVVGIATFLLKEGQNLNFAIPGNRALALYQGNIVRPSIMAPPSTDIIENYQKGPEHEVEPRFQRGPQIPGEPKVGQIVNAKISNPISDDDLKYLGLTKPGEFTIKDIQSPYVLIEQFNASCPHSMYQAPILNQLFYLMQEDATLKDKVRFMSVGQGNEEIAVKMWKTFHKVPFPVIPDPISSFSRAIKFDPYPVTVVLDKSGKIVWVHVGSFENAYETLDDIKAAIRRER